MNRLKRIADDNSNLNNQDNNQNNNQNNNLDNELQNVNNENEKNEDNDNLKSVNEILQRILKVSDDTRNDLYALFENLSAIYKNYPELYKEIEMLVKIPKEDDIRDLIKFCDSTQDLNNFFSDTEYIKQFIR